MTLRHLFAGACATALLAACQPAEEAETPDAAAVENEAPATQSADGSGEAAAETAGAEETETDRLYAWFQEQFVEELAYSPVSQTYLGMIDDLDAYGRWDDVSEDAVRAGLEREQTRLAYMRDNFDYDALTEEAQVSWRFAEFIAANNARQAEFWDHNLIFTQFFGPHSQMPTTLIGYHRIDNADHAEAYLSRLEGLGPVLSELTAQADARAQNGVVPPAFAFDTIVNTARGMITGAPFDDSGADSPLLGDFRSKVEGIELSDDERAAMIERAEAALLDSVGPAYEALIETMEAHRALADGESNGAWALPRGAEFYEAQLENYTTGLDLGAEEIHQLGLSEVDRIHEDMRAIMEAVGFEGSLQDFFAHLRESPEFYYPNTEEGRQRYLDEATAMIDEMMAASPDYFGQLPQADLEVRAVEQYRIETATGAFYEQGSLDGTRPGAYYVNLAHMDELPVYQMETLAYHEGAPGHHFQSALAQELENAPMFQRLTWYSAYGEGWALYAENLGKEMGFFTDPYQDFGRLSYEVFRAARLVVDTGIHHLQWSEQEAMDYMLANTPMTEGDIRNEVRRYMVWPGQAVSYKIGMLHILDLRHRTEEALGDDFDWGEFHDVVLTHGSVPLTLLEELVMDYIEDKQAELAE